jgi:hypothetical protein
MLLSRTRSYQQTVTITSVIIECNYMKYIDTLHFLMDI